MNESVVVQAIAPVLQTETTTLSTGAVGGQSCRRFRSTDATSSEVPYYSFTPGAAPSQATKQNLALSQQRGNVSNTVNGANFGDNNFLVDGLQDNNNHQGWGLINYPELEAIDQYNVESSVPDARFGRSGATVNVAYKSGESSFHGVAFEYLRNDATDARNFFAAGAKPELRRNDFGGTLSGPVGRKNSHTFFFVSYEGLRARNGLTFLASVPTLPMRSGDFSQLLGGTKPTLIYDPTTTRANPAGGGIVRDPFPGNVIPATLFNPAALQLINLYPQPNQPGLSGNYLLNPVDHYDTDQGSVKIDHDFSAGSRAFARFTRAYSGDINSRSLGPVATPYLAVTIPVTQAVASYTRIFSPRLINQARVGLSRENIGSNEIGVGNTARQFGIPNRQCRQNSQGACLSSPCHVPRALIISASHKDNNPAIIVSQNTQFGDNVDVVAGNHNLKLGFDVVFRQTNAYQSSYSRSLFTFGTIYTNNPAVSGTTGLGAADLLLGKPQSITLNGLSGTRGLRRSDWA